MALPKSSRLGRKFDSFQVPARRRRARPATRRRPAGCACGLRCFPAVDTRDGLVGARLRQGVERRDPHRNFSPRRNRSAASSRYSTDAGSAWQAQRHDTLDFLIWQHSRPVVARTGHPQDLGVILRDSVWPRLASAPVIMVPAPEVRFPIELVVEIGKSFSSRAEGCPRHVFRRRGHRSPQILPERTLGSSRQTTDSPLDLNRPNLGQSLHLPLSSGQSSGMTVLSTVVLHDLLTLGPMYLIAPSFRWWFSRAGGLLSHLLTSLD